MVLKFKQIDLFYYLLDAGEFPVASDTYALTLAHAGGGGGINPP